MWGCPVYDGCGTVSDGQESMQERFTEADK